MNKDFESFLNKTADNLEETAKGFEGIKDSLFGVMMGTFSQVFDMKDQDGNPIYQSLKEPELKELIDSIDEYMVPLFEEGKFEKGLKKCKEYKKLLQERLEEQK